MNESHTLEQRSRSVLRIHELNYEINHQWGRIRDIDMSTPQLVLPWTITHFMDEFSPLHQWNFNSTDELEIVAVFDGTDEAVSHSIQARWSYVPSEIIWDSTFIEMVKDDPKKGGYIVDISKLSQHHYDSFQQKQKEKKKP